MPIVAGRSSFSSGGGDGCEWKNEKKRVKMPRRADTLRRRKHARTRARPLVCR
jgi:hypothetical protein